MATVTTANARRKTAYANEKGMGMIRKLGVSLATMLLAVGLLAFPLGAAAAPADAAQANQVAASQYYNPVVYVSAEVPSGAKIGVEGFDFYAYDNILVEIYDSYGYRVFEGGITADRDGYFAGYINSSTFAPGSYTVFVSDTAGAVLVADLLVTYD